MSRFLSRFLSVTDHHLLISRGCRDYTSFLFPSSLFSGCSYFSLPVYMKNIRSFCKNNSRNSSLEPFSQTSLSPYCFFTSFLRSRSPLKLTYLSICLFPQSFFSFGGDIGCDLGRGEKESLPPL